MAMVSDIRADPFKYALILALTLTGLGLLFLAPDHRQPPSKGGYDVTFYFHPTCPHCQAQKKFNQYLRARYPELSFVERDVTVSDNARALAADLAARGMTVDKLSVPVTLIGPYTFTGFSSAERSGVAMEKAVQAYVRHDPSLFAQSDQAWEERQAVTVPLLGEFRVGDYSLSTLAVVIGLADGFNPCAMWVLVYLISLIVALQDRTKIWLLVGSFVLASAVLYFLFMTAWLNAFLFIGYLRPVTIVVGLGALGIGLISLRDGLLTQGDLACPVGDAATKQRTLGRMERIVNAPLSWFSVLGVIALAFLVNSVEFACSAALPAIFTHTLALRKLATWQYYGYLLLYDFFYMLDDLIIFSLAVLAVDTAIGNRYAKYCKVISGALLVVLGLVMAFKPDWLR